MEKNQSKEVFYYRVTDLWKRLCEEHNTLLDQTCEEYSLLLSSDVDALDIKTQEKVETIDRIKKLESLREQAIKEIRKTYSDSQIKSISDVISFFQEFENRNNALHLFRFNRFLIDIIEKIQAQNKKNQLFINKALANLKQIRESAMGIKSYSTYDKKGGTKASPVNK